jgi:hypothetical protein
MLVPGSLLLLPALAFAQEPPAPPEPPAEAVATITDREIGGHLRFLASDLMKGRDTGSPEIALAAEYLAGHLQGMGAEPLGDKEGETSSYFAHYPLSRSKPLAEGTTLTLLIEKNGTTIEIPCELNKDFLFFPRGVAKGKVEGPVVFVPTPTAAEGEEPAAPADMLKGLDLEGRFVLVAQAGPAGDDRQGGGRRPGMGFGALNALRDAAKEKLALGVLVVHPFGAESQPYGESLQFYKQFFGRESLTLGEEAVAPPVLYLEDAIRDSLDQDTGISKPEAGAGPVDGLSARFEMNADSQTITDKNVIGYFPGSDPEKSKEIVIFSAHYDHVGVGADGQIYNGSDDNASGTSALLEIAQAFSVSPRPARSVAFLWVSGEEKGLWGSKWYSDHQTLPEGYKIVANINTDMVSRNNPKNVSVTPSTEHPSHNSMVPLAQKAAEAEGMELIFDADQFFGRTDSYNFAAKGIPVIFFFSGLHEDYHQPGDDVEKADTGKAARISRLAFRLGWDVASAPSAPTPTKTPEPDAAGR